MTSPVFLNDKLSRKKSIFDLKLWVVFDICVDVIIILILFLVSLYFTSRRNDSKRDPSLPRKLHAKPTIPSVSKDVQEIRVKDPGPPLALVLVTQAKKESPEKIHIDIGKENKILYPEKAGAGIGTGSDGDGLSQPEANKLALGVVVVLLEVSHLSWVRWYTARELEEGISGYGIVYKGVLEDSTQIAVKNLLSNRSVCIPFEYGNIMDDFKFLMKVLLSQGPSRGV